LVAKSALYVKYRLEIRAHVGVLPNDGQIEAETCCKGQRQQVTGLCRVRIVTRRYGHAKSKRQKVCLIRSVIKASNLSYSTSFPSYVVNF